MKFTTIATAAVALAAPAFAARCSRRDNLGSWEYSIQAGGVPNIPSTCGGLWDNLKRFGACPVGAIATCSRLDNGDLFWDFTVGKGCNGGMVESAWWEATRNNFGGVDCP